MLRVFTSANRRVMLPLLSHRIVGAWAGSPLTGYFLTLTTTGRRTGLPRRSPLNYAILEGRIYVLSGFGTGADWYRNLSADPQVSVALPGRVVDGTAVRVRDPVEAEQAALAVVRITAADPVRPGRHDPGSNWWLLPRALGLLALVGAARAARRR